MPETLSCCRGFLARAYTDVLARGFGLYREKLYPWSGGGRGGGGGCLTDLLLAYGGCARSTSGSQNLAVLPKRHDNCLILRS